MISAQQNKTLVDERVLSEVKRLSSAGLEGPELLRRVAQKVKRSVPFDAYFAATMDPSSNLITHHIADVMGDDDKDRALYLEHVYFDEDLGFISDMVRNGRFVKLLSEETGGKLERSLRYRELRKPMGFVHELGSLFVDGSAWGGMDMVRANGSRDFSDREISLVHRITPHVGAGLKTATLRRSATTEPATDGSPGVLTLDRHGRILSHTPSAEWLLSELADLGPAWWEQDLPVAVTAVANAVRRSLAPRSDRDLNLIPRLRVRGRSGRWLTLYASLTEASNGRSGETVVVIEPTRPQEVAWLNAAAHGLTPREEEVVRLVLRGSSNKEISSSLFISEHTVQRHLSNIFEKLGVKSRTELLKRLFFEDLLPSTFGR